MSVRRIAGLACLALAVVTGLNGVRSLWGGPDIADAGGQDLAYAIGRLVVPALLLAVGFWLMQGRHRESHREPKARAQRSVPPPAETAPQEARRPAPGVRTCPACGSAVKRDAAVCPFCDAELS